MKTLFCKLVLAASVMMAAAGCSATQAQTSASELLPLLGTGFVLVAGAGVAMFVLLRPAPKACIVLDRRRRIALIKPLLVGSRLWPSIQGIAAIHAEIKQHEDQWLVELKDGRAMWVDGRPSRKNRLRDGAHVVFSMNGGAGFHFFKSEKASSKVGSARSGSEPMSSATAPSNNDFLLTEGEFVIDEQGAERCEIIRAPSHPSPCREYQARSLGEQDGLPLRLFEATTRQPLGAVIDLANALGQGVQLPQVSRLLQPFSTHWPAHGDARRYYVAEVAPANEMKSGAIECLRKAEWQLWLRQLALGLDALHKREVAFGFKAEDVLLHICVTEDGQVSWKRLCDLRALSDPALAFADVRALIAATQRIMGEQIQAQSPVHQLLKQAGQPNSQVTAEDLVFGLSRSSAKASNANSAATTLLTMSDGGLAKAGSVEFDFKTDKGMARDANEDSAMAIEIHIGNSDVADHPLLLAVSDGMGGEDAGEVASRLTLQELLKAVTHLIADEGEADPKAWVQRTVKQINDRVIEQARRLGNQMGATLVFALVHDGVAYLGNVGDSRIYRWNAKRNAGQLVRLVKDHSLVQRLVDLGEIRDEDRYTHPERNMVLRSIGDPRNARSDDSEPVPVYAGDWLLLCSDGLWEMVRDDKIPEVLAGARSPEEACKRLVDVANANGGEDNIAVVIARFS